MPRKIERLAMGIFLTATLVACSSGGGASPTAAPPAAPTAAPAAVPTAAPAASVASATIDPDDDGSVARVKEAGVLKTCAVDGLLPNSNSDSNLPGFDILLAGKLAAHLGVKQETVWVGTWDGLIPSLTSGQCDAIVDSMFVTDERRKVVDFVGPYRSGGEVILVQKSNDSIHTLDDLKAVKHVGVLQGSVTIEYLTGKGFTNLKVYPDQSTVMLDLSNGGADAAYLEAESAGWALQKTPDLNIKIVADYVPDTRYNYGIPIRKADQALLRALNDAIARLVANGELQKDMSDYGDPFFPPI